VFRLTRPEAGHCGPAPLAPYTSDPVAASASGHSGPEPSGRASTTPANATTDDSGPPSQSILCATQEERTVMDGTTQTKSWVRDGVRTGGSPAMRDGF
jgi:hypothetical protein